MSRIGSSSVGLSTNDYLDDEPGGVKVARWVAATLAVIGALNWGLVAIAEFDLVAEVFGLEFGELNSATRTVYALVALSGLALLFLLPRSLRR